MSQTAGGNEITAKVAVPKLLTIILGLCIALVVSGAANVVLGIFVWNKKTAAYGISDKGQVVPLVPLDKPYVNDARVSGFAEECLRTSFAHDFENYRLTMNNAKTCYTSDGSKDFEAAMEPMLSDIKSKNLVLSSAMEPTVVIKSYKLAGTVHWETQTPMTLYRRGTREQMAPLKFIVTSVVQRVPLDENVRGISVRSINLKPMSVS